MAGTEDTIPSHYVQAFEANLGLMPQQADSRLVDTIDSDLNYTKTGDMFNADDLQKGSGPSEIQDRFGVSPEGTPGRRRRVGFFVPFDDGQWLDDVDVAKSLSNPASETVQNMQAGLNRYRDQAIIDCLFGVAREGRNGESTVAFPAAQAVAINSHSFYPLIMQTAPTGNSPLTYSKVLEAKVKLDAAEILNGGARTFAASAYQLGQLLRDPALTSSDYNSVKALIEGEITRWAGFNWKQTELLPKVAGVRTCGAYVKNAVRYRGRKLQEVTITKRGDRKFNWYAYYKGMHGAVRRYDEGVVSVACVEP